MKEFDIVTHSEMLQELDCGDEIGWISFADLIIKSGKISISDPMFFNDLPTPPTFDIAAGRYTVAVNLVECQANIYVSRLRVSRGNSPIVGGQLETVGVDFALVGVFDPLVLGQALATSDQSQIETAVETFSTLAGWGIAQFGDDSAIMPFAHSGFGDGAYPIFELTENSHRIGLEVVFIEPYLMPKEKNSA